ncbi:MAG: NAD(+)/NADH kinase [Oscillospiraceae bacterium]|nr:NAD(+)/NADH kinase [Oscillospiraceae bacterium]
MNLLFCVNTEKEKNIETARIAAARFTSFGYGCFACESDRGALDGCPGIRFETEERATALCDMFAVFGGDGTILYHAGRAVRADKPLFGINSGRLGYLSAFDCSDAARIEKSDLESLVCVERLLLDCHLESAPDRHYYALNDVVVSRGVTAKSIELQLEYGGVQLSKLRCDGVIVSTPTGSTAYSLSAGGPIVEPDLEAVIVSPICPHTMLSRSMVLRYGEKDIRLTPSVRDDNKAMVAVDGRIIGETDHTAAVIVSATPKKLRLMISPKRDYFDVLRKDISERR